MIWETKLNKITRTKYPLVMAAFARISTVEFAAAFSNAGGLGIVTALNYSLRTFSSALEKMKSLTDKPFGVNITVVPPGTRVINGQLKESDYLKYVEIALNNDISIFTTSAYQANFIGKRVLEAGCYWIHKCSLLRHALSVQKAGVTAITLIGMEASGFKNPYQHTTMINITLAGICLGSAILATEESPLDDETKKKWLSMDILSEAYHQQLYHGKLKGTPVPSPALHFQKKIIPVKKVITNIIEEAESILKTWGFIGPKFPKQIN
ncbi:MAG: NAD(P)H-dependent flavin oxidoreductase [Promethearchaeota archaeon]